MRWAIKITKHRIKIIICIYWNTKDNDGINCVGTKCDRLTQDLNRHMRKRDPLSDGTHPNEWFHHSMETTNFSMLERRTRQRILHYGPQKVLWNNDSITFPMPATGFVQMFSNKIASLWKGSALVAYPVLAVLLNFSNKDKRWLLPNRHSLLVLPRLNVRNNSKMVMKNRLRWNSFCIGTPNPQLIKCGTRFQWHSPLMEES